MSFTEHYLWSGDHHGGFLKPKHHGRERRGSMTKMLEVVSLGNNKKRSKKQKALGECNISNELNRLRKFFKQSMLAKCFEKA